MSTALPEDQKLTFYRILTIFSLFIIVVTTSYGLIMSIFRGVEVVGQTFVDVEFPPIHIFPIFYMKPITWLNFAIIIFVYSFLEVFKERITRVGSFRLSVVQALSFLIASLSTYEALFNFTLWSGLIASEAILGKLNPDLIINPFPNPQLPWNIVFSTKLYLAATIACLYIFFYINNINKKKYLLKIEQ